MKLENGKFVVDLDMGDPVIAAPEAVPSASPDPRAAEPEPAAQGKSGPVQGAPALSPGPLGASPQDRPQWTARFAPYRRGMVALAALMVASGAGLGIWATAKPGFRAAPVPSYRATIAPNVIDAVPEPYHVVPQRMEAGVAPVAASAASNVEATLPPPLAERPLESAGDQKSVGPQVAQAPAPTPPAVRPVVHAPAAASTKQDGGPKATPAKAQEKASRAGEAEQSSVLLNLTTDEAYGRSRSQGAGGGGASSTPKVDVGRAAAPAAQPTATAQAAARRPVRLVTIISANEIVVSDPTSGLPTPVRVGAVLHDGSTLQAVDPKAGTAKTDKGVLRLE